MGEAGKMPFSFSKVIAISIALTMCLVITVKDDDLGVADGLLTVTGGIITSDTTWTSADSPVMIEGNISVGAGVTLTIQAGVTVSIEDGLFFEVHGDLIAVGTEVQPIQFTKTSTDGFDRINISAGGYAMMDYCQITSNNGVGAMDPGSMLRIYNSTITSTRGVFAYSGAEVWMIDVGTTANTNVTVSGGLIHEGNWFRFETVKDIDGTPYQGGEIKITATKPQGATWIVHDSNGNGDAKTGADGKIAPIPVEQYLHENSRSTARVMITLKMTAENSRWSKNVDNPPLYMGANMDYLWELDFTPPSPPSNLTVLEKGGDWIRVGWDYDHDQSELAYFILEYKKSWEGDSEWDRLEPSPGARDQQITDENPPNSGGGLLEEVDYDIRISCIDGHDNPSPKSDPMVVKTLDVTPPEAPRDVKIMEIGGHYANIQWNRSTSQDVLNYGIYLNGTPLEGEPDLMVPFESIQTQTYNLTGLANETEYTIQLIAFDDGEIPNPSNVSDPVMFNTLDITPPVPPTLELQYIEPLQTLPGTNLYNGTQIALTGEVEGENRTFIDVFVNDQLYTHPNPNLPRTASYKGEFFFFIILDEGDHDIKVRSIDPSLNIGPFSEVVTVRIDRKAPEIGLGLDGEEIEVDAGIETQFLPNATDENGIHSVNWTLFGPMGKLYVFQEVLEYEFLTGNYTVILNVKDNAGNVNTSIFTVISLIPDHVNPSVQVVSPEKNVDLDHAPIFKVRFTETVVWDDLDAYVIGDEAGSQRIELLSDMDLQNLTVTYQLRDSLTGGKNYSLIIKGLKDLRGNTGNDLMFEFKTIPDDEIDTDGDGIPDFYEVQRTFLNPSNPLDAALDHDDDGLTNVQEYLRGTDPDLVDSDGDQMTDGWEIQFGLSPTDNRDALSDFDSDGYTNLEEFRANTDPSDENDKPTGSSESDPTMWILLGIGLLVIIVVVVVVVILLVLKKKVNEAIDGETKEETAEETAPTWGEQVEASKGECPSCGASIEEGMEYCPECGFTIPKEEDVQSGEITDIQPEDPLMDEGIMDEEEPEEGIPQETDEVAPPDIPIEEEMDMAEPPSM